MRLWLPTSRCAHLVEDFCYHANLYCDHDHLSRAVAAQSAGRVIGVAEVAAIMQRPPGTVRVLCHRSLRRMAVQFGDGVKTA